MVLDVDQENNVSGELPATESARMYMTGDNAAEPLPPAEPATACMQSRVSSTSACLWDGSDPKCLPLECAEAAVSALRGAGALQVELPDSVPLQLRLADARLGVVALHWAPSARGRDDLYNLREYTAIIASAALLAVRRGWSCCRALTLALRPSA